MNNPTDIWRQIPRGTKKYMALDMVGAYWQLKLHKDSQDLTAFLCLRGKFRFKRAPMGTSPSGDLFGQATDNILREVPKLLKEVDDMLIYGKDYDDINETLHDTLSRCAVAGIYIAPKKIKLGERVTFGGHVFSPDGFSPEAGKLDAIKHYPVPKSVGDVRSFLGVVAQMRDWVPELQQSTKLLKGALKKGVVFQWTPDMNQEFERMKEVMSNKMVLTPFDLKRRTALFVDSSKLHGIGYMLGQ